ncbi:expressed unknown protein [Seminavis robusta]|uniref:Uncharacterized protein n=1 Tax=Seminavis robusta TaxID=568900 RepID=A0A9N8HA69_9STRA|nr:expressed unknown protein [Seminavis robusta]|eukprot:Sro282_g107570.1 n/a (286) ;mRNA; r:62737-63594
MRMNRIRLVSLLLLSSVALALSASMSMPDQKNGSTKGDRTRRITNQNRNKQKMYKGNVRGETRSKLAEGEPKLDYSRDHSAKHYASGTRKSQPNSMEDGYATWPKPAKDSGRSNQYTRSSKSEKKESSTQSTLKSYVHMSKKSRRKSMKMSMIDSAHGYGPQSFQSSSGDEFAHPSYFLSEDEALKPTSAPAKVTTRPPSPLPSSVPPIPLSTPSPTLEPSPFPTVRPTAKAPLPTATPKPTAQPTTTKPTPIPSPFRQPIPPPDSDESANQSPHPRSHPDNSAT